MIHAIGFYMTWISGTNINSFLIANLNPVSPKTNSTQTRKALILENVKTHTHTHAVAVLFLLLTAPKKKVPGLATSKGHFSHYHPVSYQ